MKKILFVFNHPAPYKVRLFNELSNFFDLSVIFERNSNKDRNRSFYSEQKYLFKIIKIKGIGFGKENFLSFDIVKHLKTTKYDLIVMNGYSTLAEMLTLRYLKRNNIPYAFYINGGIIKKKESRLKRKIKSFFISDASSYYSPDSESNKYLNYYAGNNIKIHNYTYSTIFKKEIAPLLLNEKEKLLKRSKLNIPFSKVFVSSGQLIKRKNYLELIKSWGNVNKESGLYIFGEGKERKKIQNFIHKNKISNVILMGHQPRKKLFEFYSISDAFVFPSTEDIYGHVINEAMSQGLPVISSENVNSAKKLIKDGINGFLFKSVNSKDFISSLNAVNTSEMGKNALVTASENTIEIMTKEHICYFNEDLEK